MQQTQAELRERGFMVAKTEHWNHHAKVRQDLFGFIDTLAMHPLTWDALLAVQSTDGSHLADHRKKILASPYTKVWLRHARLEIWSWSKTNKRQRGKRKLWTLRRERFKLETKNGDYLVDSYEVLDKGLV